MKKVIGLTGKYCAGKNYIASLLEKQGLPVLDIDTLGHRALETEKDAVCAEFGIDIKDITDKINRSLLGKKVFGNPKKLAKLEAIIHPVVNRLTEQWVSEQKGSCVINAALLHKSSVFNKLDFIILVNAPFISRIRRARHRDKLPWTDIPGRFSSQKDFYPQYFSGKADIYRVENPGFSMKQGVSLKPGYSSVRRTELELKRRINEILKKEGIL